MNRFYIEKLMVSGGGHHASVIDFKPGLNFILGPSNTGKSLVMDCLDYMFGFTPKKNKPSKIVDNNNGYELITLQLATANGTVILERKIGESKITVMTAPSLQLKRIRIFPRHIMQRKMYRIMFLLTATRKTVRVLNGSLLRVWI